MEEAAFPTASEGFREVYWGTRQSEIPWNWNDDGFGQMCFIREDEDFEVFGVRAGALTYTFRNSIFYGVRIDFEGVDQSNDAEQALLGLKQVASKFSINSKSPKSELPGLVRARP